MKDKGLPCPTPVKIKDHVMIMEFIGEGSKAAPSKTISLPLNVKDCETQSFLRTK